MSGIEAVIGLEIHVQLGTATKLFCADRIAAGGQPNSRVCAVCLGLPGALPVLNASAVELALRAALGLGCTVHETSVFDRKSYFYPDLPKGYQITQLHHPLATGGELDGVRIRRVHLEEDAARLLHDRIDHHTAIDCNRAGVPLIEIVTEPDLGSAAEARRFATRLRRTLRYLGVSECDMENGSLRIDANVSVRRAEMAGAPIEIKNLNSFGHLEHAIGVELERQSALLAGGGTVLPETRLWDAVASTTRSMRLKEGTDEYRYFPDPDLPPVHVDAHDIVRIRAGLPELPAQKELRFAAAYDLPHHDIEVLTGDRALADYFEAVAAEADARAAAHWILTDVLRWLNRHGSRVEEVPVDASALAELIGLVKREVVSRTAASRAFLSMAETGASATEAISTHGLTQVRDEGLLGAWVEQVIEQFPDEAARCGAGETKLMAFLVGELMNISGGTADPRRLSALLRRRLQS